MGCSISGLNALYDVVQGGPDVWVNERKFKILKQIGEGGFAFVYLVKEQQGVQPIKLPKDAKYIAEDGLYALKKVLIQTDEQLDLVKQEIHASSLFNHPNLLPLLEHSIISAKGEGAWIREAYLLFPVYEDGTLLDILNGMRTKKEYFSTLSVLHIFKQICEGLKEMHTLDPPYAHNDVKPGNVLLSKIKEQLPLAVLMDFGSAASARKQVQSRSEALALQVRCLAFRVFIRRSRWKFAAGSNERPSKMGSWTFSTIP
ncbi:hypothetical protein O6H91_08G088300 [Diphasiastrum complanatum]|uniref:Uncharacterized protein n=1 Tax=Diphasiastrum complanatum TaxID=34168 RepID=A0ACC2CZV2_DIPCM|nr:hypothetical protein O6H91_08G088300 [Diphasiastrum complanatum]